MYTVHLGLSGAIRNLRLIADILSLQIKIAEPLLTLPLVYAG
jgi:hypothetical protein